MTYDELKNRQNVLNTNKYDYMTSAVTNRYKVDWNHKPLQHASLPVPFSLTYTKTTKPGYKIPQKMTSRLEEFYKMKGLYKDNKPHTDILTHNAAKDFGDVYGLIGQGAKMRMDMPTIIDSLTFDAAEKAKYRNNIRDMIKAQKKSYRSLNESHAARQEAYEQKIQEENLEHENKVKAQRSSEVLNNLKKLGRKAQSALAPIKGIPKPTFEPAFEQYGNSSEEIDEDTSNIRQPPRTTGRKQLKITNKPNRKSNNVDVDSDIEFNNSTSKRGGHTDEQPATEPSGKDSAKANDINKLNLMEEYDDDKKEDKKEKAEAKESGIEEAVKDFGDKTPYEFAKDTTTKQLSINNKDVNSDKRFSKFMTSPKFQKYADAVLYHIMTSEVGRQLGERTIDQFVRDELVTVPATKEALNNALRKSLPLLAMNSNTKMKPFLKDDVSVEQKQHVLDHVIQILNQVQVKSSVPKKTIDSDIRKYFKKAANTSSSSAAIIDESTIQL